MTSLYELKDITYKNILNIDNLIIPENKVICIVGESGSGKTTLIKHLNNLISCDAGTIYYKGQNIDEINPIKLRREVVMLPQVPVIFPGSIGNNINIGLTFSGNKPVDDSRLQEVLNIVHLQKGLSDDAGKLSGGEKQRVALARVLLMHPDVLLLDEPSSALDEETEHLVIDSVVKYVRDNNKSLIMVTHTKKIAREYGEGIIIMDKGRVIGKEGIVN
ncbi:MAG: ABC transporter ATP-binding protein [Thermoanaerobacteraceae bacterium]|nr:ABC transporter ATP-binding protein [Thermoanaerobacteraceae bacterium]